MARPSGFSASISANLVCALFLAVVVFAITAHDVALERGGPGVTCDELYHVGYGKRLVTALLRHGLGFWRTECIRETFGWSPEGPPVHPPLGNWILGWFHWLFDPAPLELSRLAITPGRLGTAVCFGLLVFLVSWAGGHFYGLVGGLAAGVSLVLMPRLFGHAHLAALDLITALFCTAAIVAVAKAHESGERLGFLLAGLVWGLALLTRFHGLLCAPPVILWLFWQRRTQALVPVCLWLGAGVVVFFLGWPWLWLDPLANLRLYLSSSTQRLPIHVFYLGQVWDDVTVPRHYPWVMFLATIPVGLLVLGLLPLVGKKLFGHRRVAAGDIGVSDQASAATYLFLGTLVFFLATFTGPRVPVYDGVRLFLPAYPLWGLLVGQGSQYVWQWLIRLPRLRYPQGPVIVLTLLFLSQSVGVIWFRPVWLSYYNLLVGGLAGASRLGFEVNYWGDALTEDILSEAAEGLQKGETLVFGPSLAPYQGVGLAISSPSLVEKEIVVAGWPAGAKTPPASARWLVLYHRRADLDQIPEDIRNGPVVSEILCQGVWLARLIRLRQE